MGYKAKNKQAPPQPIPGSDLYKDPRNKPARKGKKSKAAAAPAVNGKRKADDVVEQVVKKQKKVASTNGLGRKGKGKAEEEDFDTEEEADDDILQPG
jgi:hypothetical protein